PHSTTMTPPAILHLLLLLFTAALLLTHLPNAFSATTHCPNCGTTPVPYPLSTSPTCGDPQYRIRCNAGKLMFDTVNNSYPITSINPSTQRLVIQPATLSAPNTCVTWDYSGHGVQLNNSLPFNITGSNTVMFFNCSAMILDSPLNCSSTSLCHVYLNSSNGQEKAACRAAPVCCTFRAGGGATAYMIRVRPGGCGAYTSFVNLDAGQPVGQWPRPGLEIQWALPQEPSTSPTCGDPHYRIRCNAGKLMFDTVNNSYPITSINPSTQRLVIQPATLSAPNTCVTSDYSGQGVQLNNSLPFNITGSNTVMFFNCSAEILDSPLNCSSTNLCHVYLNNSNSQEEEAACRAAPVCCTFRAGGGATAYMIRVRPGGCGAYTSFVNLDAGRPVGQWPRPGLEIQWAMPQEPLCGSQVDCDENSTCAADGSRSGSPLVSYYTNDINTSQMHENA
ncbi:hypothetical protein Tsubulata_025899, partial [Turnera subulata]